MARKYPILGHFGVPKWGVAKLEQTSSNRAFGCSGDFEVAMVDQAIEIFATIQLSIGLQLDGGRW
jgi:hypothetical protein